VARQALNKLAFYGEPAQLCDAGVNQIKVLAPLILPQKFLGLFNQRLPGSMGPSPEFLRCPRRIAALARQKKWVY
jgi:hypothetical protein